MDETIPPSDQKCTLLQRLIDCNQLNRLGRSKPLLEMVGKAKLLVHPSGINASEEAFDGKLDLFLKRNSFWHADDSAVLRTGHARPTYLHLAKSTP